ncbi:hypothetical protein F4777DRAFT_582579 [Nemania sp. FL0916]|nr:hypothetical protein F4777DRAFT_582579 [Nemania sp. FL0916]
MDLPNHKIACHETQLKATFESDCRLPAWAPQPLYSALVRKYHGIENQDTPRIGSSDHSDEIYRPKIQFDLFGSFPAIDVLRLDANEGINTTRPLDILFIEPEDLRDIIMTVINLPANTAYPVNVWISNHNVTRRIRQLILLLLALSSTDPDITAECAVPFWYSPFIPKWCIPAIQALINPLIDRCMPHNDTEENDTEAGLYYFRRLSFGNTSLEVFFDEISCLFLRHEKGEYAGLDYDEQQWLAFPGSWQPSKRQYTSSMQVAPFANHFSSEDPLQDSNPSILLIPDWPMRPDADALRGWDLKAINRGTIGAKNDIYGKLFYYVRDIFKQFIIKLRTANVKFHVMPGWDRIPQEKLRNHKFDRIHVSTNVSTNAVFGPMDQVVSQLSPQLKPPTVNPLASLITLHTNIFEEIQRAFPCKFCRPDTAERIKEAVTLTPEERGLLDAYLPLTAAKGDPVNWVFTTAGWQRREARWLFRDPTAAWELYKEVNGLHELAEDSGLAMKDTNTITEPWILRHSDPRRLDGLRRPVPAAQFEFDMLYARRQTGGYRYVEWRHLTASEMTALEAKQRVEEQHPPKSRNHWCPWPTDDEETAEMRRRGAHLERWMGQDNYENWTPF